jgi:hypothetical protein
VVLRVSLRADKVFIEEFFRSVKYGHAKQLSKDSIPDFRQRLNTLNSVINSIPTSRSPNRHPKRFISQTC